MNDQYISPDDKATLLEIGGLLNRWKGGKKEGKNFKTKKQNGQKRKINIFAPERTPSLD